VKEYLDRAGLHCFDAARGIQALEQLWCSENPQPIAVAADWKQLLAHGPCKLPILENLRSEVLSDTPEATAEPAQVLSAEEYLQNLIGSLISANGKIDMTSPLLDQGLDSLGATVLVESLYRDYGMTVDADAFADGLSLRDLVERVGVADRRRYTRSDT
jgi:acyl carrier protein